MVGLEVLTLAVFLVFFHSQPGSLQVRSITILSVLAKFTTDLPIYKSSHIYINLEMFNSRQSLFIFFEKFAGVFKNWFLNKAFHLFCLPNQFCRSNNKSIMSFFPHYQCSSTFDLLSCTCYTLNTKGKYVKRAEQHHASFSRHSTSTVSPVKKEISWATHWERPQNTE